MELLNSKLIYKKIHYEYLKLINFTKLEYLNNKIYF